VVWPKPFTLRRVDGDSMSSWRSAPKNRSNRSMSAPSPRCTTTRWLSIQGVSSGSGPAGGGGVAGAGGAAGGSGAPVAW
jgi:hypothetical protein